MNTGCFPGVRTKNQRRVASFSSQYRPTSGPSTESGPTVSLVLGSPPGISTGRAGSGACHLQATLTRRASTTLVLYPVCMIC